MTPGASSSVTAARTFAEANATPLYCASAGSFIESRLETACVIVADRAPSAALLSVAETVTSCVVSQLPVVKVKTPLAPPEKVRPAQDGASAVHCGVTATSADGSLASFRL